MDGIERASAVIMWLVIACFLIVCSIFIFHVLSDTDEYYENGYADGYNEFNYTKNSILTDYTLDNVEPFGFRSDAELWYYASGYTDGYSDREIDNLNLNIKSS